MVFHELVPGQQPGDRLQVLWIVFGNRLYRTSVHSVRPLSEREQAIFEARSDGSPGWHELRDLIPRRDYVDIVGEEPEEQEREEPQLPDQPPEYPVIRPQVRFKTKMGIDMQGNPIEKKLKVEHPVNDYESSQEPQQDEPGDEEATGTEMPDLENLRSGSRRSSTTSKAPLIDKDADDDDHESKKPRLEDDLMIDIQSAVMEVDEGYVMELELDMRTRR